MDRAPLKALFSRGNLLVAGLLLLVVLSGLSVSYVSFQNRRLLGNIQQAQENRNRAQVEWGKLLLEHSTLTTPAYVEQMARENLDMEVPESGRIELVLP